MTLSEEIRIIDLHLPGNRFDNTIKTLWINEIEGKVFDEIISKTFKPEGNQIRYATRDGEGNWKFSPYLIEKDPEEILEEELPEENEEETDNPEGEEDQEEMEQIPNYADQIDPLNMRCGCCCNKGNRSAYELVPYSFPTDQNKQLLVPDRFCDLYTHYVLAKMHYADEEGDSANNESILFDASYKDYAAWSIRNFKWY